MSRQTTAMVIAAPRAQGPWGDELCRPTHVVRFTENSVPGWQVHSLDGAHDNHEPSTGSGTHASMDRLPTMAHELVVLLAVEVAHDPQAITLATAERLIRPGRGPAVAFGDTAPSPELVTACAKAVADTVRLWVTVLDPQALLVIDGSISQLGDWGITVDVLTATPTA